MKKILLFIFLYAGTAYAMNDDMNNISLSDESESSGRRLFILDTEKTLSKSELTGNYRLNVTLDDASRLLFETRIKDLFSSFDHLEVQGPDQSKINFTDKDKFHLGIDLNFAAGNVLSKNTVITQIWKREGSQVIDGKVDYSMEPVDTYSVYYKVIGEDDIEHNITFGDYISGTFESNTHSITFDNFSSLKTGSCTINAVSRDLSKKKKKLKRGNDVIILDEVK